MTQAVLGAGIPIRPGNSAREVWVPLLVEHGRRVRRSSKLVDDWQSDGTKSDADGNVTAHSASTATEIIDLIGLAADYIEHLVTQALAASLQERSDQASSYKTALGRNLDRCREACGWTFDECSRKTGLDRRLIIGHVREGKGANVKTLKLYADAFSKELRRTVTVAELNAAAEN